MPICFAVLMAFEWPLALYLTLKCFFLNKQLETLHAYKANTFKLRREL